MKKKVIATMLVGSMLMMPLPLFADEKDNYLHKLSFDKITEEMKKRSPIIVNMGDDLWEAENKISDGIEDLKAMKQGMENNPKAPTGYVKGMTSDQVKALAPKAEDVELDKTTYAENDLEVLKFLAAQFNYMALQNYVSQIEALDKQIKELEKSDDDFWKSWLQIESGKNQTIRGAQQLFLGYFSAKEGRDELKANLDLLESKLKVAKLQESLGMATTLSIVEAETQIKELKNALESLDRSLENLKGNLNIMLGQDYDTELDLVEPSEVTRSMIRDIDYDKDLKDALIQSYDVRLAEESDDIKQAKKEFTFAFHQAYQNLLDKQKALELAQEKLNLEQKKFDQNYLMYSLGLIARVDFDGISSMYRTKVNAVESAERELLQAYTDYEWMKKGLKISASSGGSGASSASAASASSASGMRF